MEGLAVLLALATTVVSLLFAVCLLDQYLERRKPYQAVWTAGLTWYAIGTLTEFLGEYRGWDSALYRWWYVAGAICVAAYLGAGVVFLLTPGPFAYVVIVALVLGALPALFAGAPGVAVAGLVAAALLLVTLRVRPAWFSRVGLLLLVGGSLLAALAVWSAPLDASRLPVAGGAVSGAAFPATIRLMTPLFNITGATALVGGALYSAWLFWQRGQYPRRVVSNVLIAVGAFIPTMATGLSRFGVPRLLYPGEFLGVLFIFAGFLVSVDIVHQFRIPFTRVVIGRRAGRAHAGLR